MDINMDVYLWSHLYSDVLGNGAWKFDGTLIICWCYGEGGGGWGGGANDGRSSILPHTHTHTPAHTHTRFMRVSG